MPSVVCPDELEQMLGAEEGWQFWSVLPARPWLQRQREGAAPAWVLHAESSVSS